MTNEIETAKPIETQVAEWSATDAGLRAVVETTAGISVEAHAEGPAKGYKAVEAARKLLKVHRTAIEGRRKELKAPILELGKLVDAEAKRLTEIVEPREMELAADAKAYEDRLEAERKAEEARVAAERAEADRLAREKLQSRIDSVQALGGTVDLAYLQTAGDDEIASMLARLRAEKEESEAAAAKEESERAERERLEAIATAEREAKEAAARAARDEEERVRREAAEAEAAAERQRLAAERAEMDRRQAEIDEQERKVREDREALERKEREQAEAEERRVREAREAQEKSERLAREAAEHKQAEEAAAALEAARRPDLEKLRTWASEWLAARPELPEIADKSIEAAMLKAARDVADILSTLA